MNPYFVARVQEVGSLDLCRLPEATNTTTPRIAGYAPFIYHGSKRATACDSPIIAMPFFALFNRITGEPRFTDRGHLAETFKISRDSILIASATEKDGPLERWWKLDAGKKQLVYENLRRLDIDLVTGPNYSVFNNVPFWNNWYNQKRSALSWCEFMSEGVPCALHLNAHKKEDYEEFLRLLVARPDVTTLSVEFKTGMGHASRIQWHSAQLCRLALRTGRPLHLVMRGGKAIVHDIYNSFSTVLFIDTEPFVKTQQRQKAFEGNDQRLSWRPEATGLGETLDARLQESIELSQKNFETLRAKQPDQAKLIGRLTNYRGQKSPDMSERRQLSLF